jgi:hypothetical protein
MIPHGRASTVPPRTPYFNRINAGFVKIPITMLDDADDADDAR